MQFNFFYLLTVILTWEIFLFDEPQWPTDEDSF